MQCGVTEVVASILVAFVLFWEWFLRNIDAGARVVWPHERMYVFLHEKLKRGDKFLPEYRFEDVPPVTGPQNFTVTVPANNTIPGFSHI